MTLNRDPLTIGDGINQISRQEVVSELQQKDGNRRSRIIFAAPHLLSALSRLGFKNEQLGRDENIVGFYALRDEVDFIPADNIIYIVNPDLEILRPLTVHLLSYTQRFTKAVPTILFCPQKSLMAEQVLEQEFRLSQTFPSLTIGNLDMDFLFLERNVFTMELPTAFKAIFADGDITCLSWIARLLLKLQTSRYGAIPCIRGKGGNAAKVVNLLHRMQTEVGKEFMTDIPSEIDTLLIMDRSMDLVTPLMTQLTYEGLIDELYEIENCEVKFPFSLGENSNVPMGQKITIDSGDRMFAELRDRNFTTVGTTLYQKSVWVKQNYEKRKEVQQLKELKEFMKGLPEMQETHRLIGVHTTAATEISKVTQSSEFRRRIAMEHNIIQQCNDKEVLEFIEDLVFRREKLEHVVRLLALYSLVNDGVREKDLMNLKENMMLAYGIPHIISAFFICERCGLIKKSGGKSDQYGSIRKRFRTWNTSLDEENPNDIAYAYSGYAPLLVRAVKMLLSSPDLWSAPEGPLDMLPGEKASIKNNVEISGTTRTVMVFVIGGLTAAEVSALHFVEDELTKSGKPCRLIVGSTSITSGNHLIDTLLPFQP